MNSAPEPQVRLSLWSSHGRTEVRVQVSLRFRLPGPRLIAILVMVAATLAHNELFALAGLLTGTHG